MANKLHMLLTQDEDESKALETDVMRFMAIVGIIFWIIFAMVKSLPFQDTKSSQVIKPPPVIVPSSVPTPKPIPEPTPAPEPIPEPEPTPEPTLTPEPPMPGTQTLTVNFRSIEELKTLMENDKVVIFIETHSQAFDLTFKASIKDGSFSFKGIERNKLPDNLWKILSGIEYNYFKNLIDQAYPVAKASPVKEVYINFKDTELESQIDRLVAELSKQKRYGKIRIDKTGDIEFDEAK
ncbi:MAG: hypothetical protein KJ550_03770 [Proteobacteria bacterium]|nr:hypothetical protein [Pseudomonadota bacterium]MBU4068318.1 hypothetical protein [Pseudomonadota bacterium]MBU4099975.1 hypothetical protein [Pseudomonadota bacterium]